MTSHTTPEAARMPHRRRPPVETIVPRLEPGSCPLCGAAKLADGLCCAECARGGSEDGPNFRVSCMACARSSETRVPARLRRRCVACGGTLLVERTA